MKKTLKLMLAFVLVALCSTSAWAQADPVFGDDAYRYTDEELGFTFKFTDIKKAATTAKATITAMTPAKRAEADGNTYKKIVIPTSFQYVDGADTYDVTVTTWESPVFQNCEYATEVTIPACITAIPEYSFNGCTRITSITFEEGSQVETIGQWAFATTAIEDFDFTNCSVLAELPNEVFVLPGENNTFITKITVPTSADFKHVNGAFQNLTKLATIENLGECYIQEIVADAFSGCESLKDLSLPGINMRYIDGYALRGSSVENLTVNVGEEDGVIHRLLYLGGGTVAKNVEGVYEYIPYFYTQNGKVIREDWARDPETGEFLLTEVGTEEIPVYETDPVTGETLLDPVTGDPIPHMVPAFDNAGQPIMEDVVDGDGNPVFEQAKDADTGALLWDGYEMDTEADPAVPVKYAFTDAEAAAADFDPAFEMQLTDSNPNYLVSVSPDTWMTEAEALAAPYSVSQIAAFKKLYYKRLPKYVQEEDLDGDGNPIPEVQKDDEGNELFVMDSTDPTKKAVTGIANAADVTEFNVRATTEAQDDEYEFSSYGYSTPDPSVDDDPDVLYANGKVRVDEEDDEFIAVTVLTNTSANTNVSAEQAASFVGNQYYLDPEEVALGGYCELFEDEDFAISADVWVMIGAHTQEAAEADELYIYDGDPADLASLGVEPVLASQEINQLSLALAKKYIPAYWTKQTANQTHNKVAQQQKMEPSTGERPIYGPYMTEVEEDIHNLYGLTYTGANPDNKGAAPLKTLTLEGVLEGKICSYAFMDNDKLVTDGTLDLTSMTFASTGQIETNTFQGCTFKAVSVGNIQDTESASDDFEALDGYTIDNLAFNDCKRLATVTLGDVLTANAIGEQAFFNQLKEVTIGSVNAEGSAFASDAFVWKDAKGAILYVATGTGKYISQKSTSVIYPTIPTSAFNFSAIINHGNSWKKTDYPTVEIGAIKSRGGAFGDGAFNPGYQFNTFEFKGDIVSNGIDATIIGKVEVVAHAPARPDGDDGDDYYGDDDDDDDDDIEYEVKPFAGLDALTFHGAIANGGVGTAAFDNLTGLKVLNFKGKLAEEAVAAGAFGMPVGSTPAGYQLNYTYAGTIDYAVNPFAKNAFNLTSVCASPRYIILTVVNEDLKARFADENRGLTTDGKYDVYLVKFYQEGTTPDPVVYSFRVYKNYKNADASLNNVNTAWGRYDLGSFALEQGPADPTKPYLYTPQNMVINRYQHGVTGYDQEAGAATTAKEDVKITLYGVYTDENPMEKESTVYMVPLKVVGGQYHIPATNNKLIVVKVEKNSELAATDYDIVYSTPATLTANSVWNELPSYDRDDPSVAGSRQQFKKASHEIIVTNQMLWDYSGTKITVWDKIGTNNQPIPSQGVSAGKDFADKAIFLMMNPKNYKGSPVNRMLVRKEENGAYIGRDWTFAIMSSWGYDPKETAAKVVWLDEDEATAIFGVNDDAIAENGSQESGLVNIQGVAVDASYVGLVIDKATGKKFYQNINK